MGQLLNRWLEPVIEPLRGGGPGAAAIFVVLQITTCVLLLPGGFLTLTVGGIFGVIKGAALVLAGCNLGASAAFLTARYLFQPAASRALQRYPRLCRIEKGIENDGWKAVILIRLCPLFPFRVTNYALGASKLRFKDFVIGTAIGTFPSTFSYVAIGALSGKLFGAVQDGRLSWALLLVVVAVGLLAFAALARRISKAADRAIDRSIGKCSVPA